MFSGEVRQRKEHFSGCLVQLKFRFTSVIYTAFLCMLKHRILANKISLKNCEQYTKKQVCNIQY